MRKAIVILCIALALVWFAAPKIVSAFGCAVFHTGGTGSYDTMAIHEDYIAKKVYGFVFVCKSDNASDYIVSPQEEQ